jgi:hypothetical protein
VDLGVEQVGVAGVGVEQVGVTDRGDCSFFRSLQKPILFIQNTFA